MNLKDALYQYISHDAALHTRTAILFGIFFVLAIVVICLWARDGRRLDEAKKKLAGAQEGLDITARNANRLNDEVSKWRKFFGPFPGLYENTPEMAPQHDSNATDIAIDLDGVIFSYDGIWRGPDYCGKVMPGAIEAMKKLREMGYRLSVYTTRNNCMTKADGANVLELTAKVQNHLESAGIPYDYIALFKPLARYYIDDRAIRFVNWDITLKALRNLEILRLNKRVDALDKMAGFVMVPPEPGK